MKNNEVKKFVEALKKAYPDATCSLDFNTPFELVVAVALSAQCTDERVNKVTPALFKRCPTIKDFAEIDLKEWKIVERQKGIKDDKNPYDYEYVTYVRI